MPLKQSEAVVLRTYPLREADLLVTLFTRAEGKIRGVARSAKKSKKRFGGALEPLTCVRAYWEERERQDLTRLDSCEVLQSPLAAPMDYPRLAALEHVGEMLDETLPDREVNDAVFRLTVAVLSNLKVGAIWMPLTYFDLWLTRLVGYLPDLDTCVKCGETLNGSRAYFHAMADGLMCAADKRLASSEITAESRTLAIEMFRSSITAMNGAAWPKQRGADLRKLVVQTVERHIEKKLVTAGVLDRIE